VRKAQERNIWWKGLNAYKNKFKVPDTKHETGSKEKNTKKKL
jgi:hypothetical protein